METHPLKYDVHRFISLLYIKGLMTPIRTRQMSFMIEQQSHKLI